MKVLMKSTTLHGLLVDPEDPSAGSYSLRFDEGKVYDVDPEIGGLFRGMGCAEAVPTTKAAKAEASERGLDLDEIAEPFDTRNATEEDAERWEREVLAPGRERQRVSTIRQIGTGTNEVLKGDPYEFPEGEDGQVVDQGRGESAEPDGGVDLDVHNSSSGSGASF